MDIEKSSKSTGPAVVAGLREVTRGIKDNRIKSVTIALNADEKLKNQLSNICLLNKIPMSYIRSKEELGQIMGLEVGCSVTGELK